MAGQESHAFRTIPLLVVLNLLSFPVYAEYSGGTGEPNDPYQIATAEDLLRLGESPEDYDKHFILTADIDLDPDLPGGRVFGDALIAPESSGGVSGHSGASFRGVFDGQGHTIANLHIMGKYGYDAGLFGMLDGLVKDVNLTDVVVIGSPCGAIVGLNHGGMILRCHVSGMVLGIEEVGGLFGDARVPVWAPMAVACFWDVELSKITAGASTRMQDLDLGTGLTTEQMQDQQLFENAGWDFDYTWTIREGQYPTLQWEGQN